jgi:hypothetical protein
LKTLWSRRILPVVHKRSATPAKDGVIRYLPAWEYPRVANRLSGGDVQGLLGATTFASSPNVGDFETLLSGLPFATLKGLSKGGTWIHHGDVLLRYRRDRNEGVLSVRQGNAWGTVVNAPELLNGVELESEAFAVLNDAASALKPVGLRAQDLRGPGYAASLVLHGELLGRLPRAPHLQRFLNSFRGGRFEATTFGTIPICHDYDISSAYPYYLSTLVSTSACTWHDSTDLGFSSDAIYAAALCDVEVPDTLQRSPVAHRLGEHSLFFPVGKLNRVWLNLPEIRLLLDHPDVGRITKVLEASWGVPFAGVQPFANIVAKLYKIRRAHPEIAPFVKRIMVAMWGKTWSRYPVGRQWQSPSMWNPIYASAVTAAMRADNYRRTLGAFVYGEFVDGFAVDQPQRESKGLGGIRHEGSGKMLVVTDLFKKSSWKTFFVDFENVMRDDPDGMAVTVRAEYARTLSEVIEYRMPPSSIGMPTEQEWAIPLGTSIRNLNGGGFNNRDFLSGAIGSTPIRERDMPTKVAMRLHADMQGFDGIF